MNTIKQSEIDELHKNIEYWESEAKRGLKEAEYYQKELECAHALLGRVLHQLSERWDTVNLTKYYPTDNLHNKRSIINPEGIKGVD